MEDCTSGALIETKLCKVHYDPRLAALGIPPSGDPEVNADGSERAVSRPAEALVAGSGRSPNEKALGTSEAPEEDVPNNAESPPPLLNPPPLKAGTGVGWKDWMKSSGIVPSNSMGIGSV